MLYKVNGKGGGQRWFEIFFVTKSCISKDTTDTFWRHLFTYLFFQTSLPPIHLC